MNKLIKVTQSLNSSSDELEELEDIEFVPALFSYLNFGDIIYQVRAIEHIRNSETSIKNKIYVVEAQTDWKGKHQLYMISLPK